MKSKKTNSTKTNKSYNQKPETSTIQYGNKVIKNDNFNLDDFQDALFKEKNKKETTKRKPRHTWKLIETSESTLKVYLAKRRMEENEDWYPLYSNPSKKYHVFICKINKCKSQMKISCNMNNENMLTIYEYENHNHKFCKNNMIWIKEGVENGVKSFIQINYLLNDSPSIIITKLKDNGMDEIDIPNVKKLQNFYIMRGKK